ncbi:chromosome partitioning protein ParB, partial [Citrobacter freundii]|nr:chromosome partitioning protein ParB [Citrobacter freundii]
LRQRCESGEQAKKVINEILNRNIERAPKEPAYRISLSKSQYSAILELLNISPEDIDNPEEDIETILKNKLEELASPQISEEAESE